MSNRKSRAGKTRRPLVLIGAMLTMFMVAVEATIVATALPSIVADLGGFDQFSWVFAIFLLTQVVAVPIYGRLADLYGRKPMFYSGATIFLLGSTACGFAHSMLALIIFRAVQGIGAGALQPTVYTVMGDIYTAEERARVQGAISGVWGVSAVAGPLLGALIVDHLDWPLVFWINLPIGAAAVVLFSLFLHENVERRQHRIDWQGALLFAIATSALLLALIQGATLPGWAIVALLVVAAAVGAAFFVQQQRSSEPMMQFELWRNRIIATGNLGGLAAGSIMMGVTLILPIYVQGAIGGPPLAAGLVLGAMSISWPAATMMGGRLMAWSSYRAVAALGALVLIAGSVFLLFLTPERGTLWAGAGSLIIGFGMGFTTIVFLVSIQSSVAWEQRGAATASHVFMRMLGQVLGAAVYGAILNFGLHRRAPDAIGLVDKLMDPIQRRMLGGAEMAELIDALAASLHDVYWVSIALSAAALAFALWIPTGLSPRSHAPAAQRVK
jgi:EmrB/QacA subfamily drug resistance transporter